MLRRQFVKKCATGVTVLAAASTAESWSANRTSPSSVSGSTARFNELLPQRFETPLAIYEKRHSGNWITLKPGTTMAAMAEEVEQLHLPFTVLKKDGGEFTLRQTKVANGLSTLHNRAFSPSRILT